MLNKKQLEQIKKFAIDLDWNQAFEGAAKGNKHLFRIVGKAKLLAKKENSSQKQKINLNIIEAGAWLHDSNLEQTILGDTLTNKEKLKKFFKKIKIIKEDQEKILHCIESHDGRKKAKTIEAKIVHDADTLEKMGPLGIIRETWKRCQAGWNTEKIIEHLKTHLKKRESKIYWSVSRKWNFSYGTVSRIRNQVIENSYG